MSRIQSPSLQIPPGSTTVLVSAVDSTLWLNAAPAEYMYSPAIPGFGRVRAGCWSLYIRHPSGRSLIYDLGCRKDWQKLPPACGIQTYLDSGVMESVTVEKNVSEILMEGGVRLESIEGVIWSHFHWDHTGDVSTFPKSTKLIMGPGAKEAFMPGFPKDPNAHTLASDFEGREVVEVDFDGEGTLKIGNFKAMDYFGDGSFYLLDSPGHAVGHLNAVARTGEEEFVHLCGDSAHHCGEIRPSMYVPLPESIEPSPVPERYVAACPGHIFDGVLRNGSREEHILEFVDGGKGMYKEQKYALIYDEDKLRDTIRKVEGLDAEEKVFTILAHDWTLKGVIEEWPKNLNGWRQKGWKGETWWKFLGDFAGATVEKST